MMFTTKEKVWVVRVILVAGLLGLLFGLCMQSGWWLDFNASAKTPPPITDFTAEVYTVNNYTNHVEYCQPGDYCVGFKWVSMLGWTEPEEGTWEVQRKQPWQQEFKPIVNCTSQFEEATVHVCTDQDISDSWFGQSVEYQLVWIGQDEVPWVTDWVVVPIPEHRSIVHVGHNSWYDKKKKTMNYYIEFWNRAPESNLVIHDLEGMFGPGEYEITGIPNKPDFGNYSGTIEYIPGCLSELGCTGEMDSGAFLVTVEAFPMLRRGSKVCWSFVYELTGAAKLPVTEMLNWDCPAIVKWTMLPMVYNGVQPSTTIPSTP